MLKWSEPWIKLQETPGLNSDTETLQSYTSGGPSTQQQGQGEGGKQGRCIRDAQEWTAA